MSASLVIAVPAKGRLQENAEAFFGRAGLRLVKPRGDVKELLSLACFDTLFAIES